MRLIPILHFGSHSRSIVGSRGKKRQRISFALKEVMKLEQFTNCLPTGIHRWVVEKRPMLLVDAGQLADEYAVLYKPFHAEQDNSWKSDDRNFSDKPDKTFHKNGGRGTFHQKYHHKGNYNHKTAVPVTKNWAQEVL